MIRPRRVRHHEARELPQRAVPAARRPAAGLHQQRPQRDDREQRRERPEPGREPADALALERRGERPEQQQQGHDQRQHAARERRLARERQRRQHHQQDEPDARAMPGSGRTMPRDSETPKDATGRLLRRPPGSCDLDRAGEIRAEGVVRSVLRMALPRMRQQLDDQAFRNGDRQDGQGVARCQRLDGSPPWFAPPRRGQPLTIADGRSQHLRAVLPGRSTVVSCIGSSRTARRSRPGSATGRPGSRRSRADGRGSSAGEALRAARAACRHRCRHRPASCRPRSSRNWSAPACSRRGPPGPRSPSRRYRTARRSRPGSAPGRRGSRRSR